VTSAEEGGVLGEGDESRGLSGKKWEDKKGARLERLRGEKWGRKDEWSEKRE